MGYYGYCRYYSGCNIIPMIKRIRNKFFGHSVNKHRIYRHYVSEITYNNVSFNQVLVDSKYFNKIPFIGINVELLLLVLLLLIILT